MPASALRQESGRDEHSLAADAMFVDPAKGDYRVQPGSPALSLGLVNFSMDQFGVRTPKLKAIARTPKLPTMTNLQSETLTSTRDAEVWTWMGAEVRNVIGPGEVSECKRTTSL